MKIVYSLLTVPPTDHRDRSYATIWIFAFLIVSMLVAPKVTFACPPGMVLIDGQFCIDQYESSLDQNSIAVSIPGVYPEININQLEASNACNLAAKRLCTDPEWLRACKGPDDFTYPYGNTLISGACNGAGSIFESPSSLSETGTYQDCVTAEGVYDMVGNVGEWTDDPNGTFRGGSWYEYFFNGYGCNYSTTAHNVSFWDDRTGFRCCSDDIQSIRTLSCVGFEPPMDKGAIKVKKNRVIPLTGELLYENLPVIDTDLSLPPEIQIIKTYDSADPVDVTDDALPAGQGTEGNQFVFDDGTWKYNLQTKNYTGPGTYTIKMVPGDGSYIIDPSCTGIFVIE